MKRSVGVTVWAVLLIVAGLLGVGGSLYSLAAGPRSLETMAERMRQLEALPQGTGQGQIPPEAMAKLHQQFEGLMREMREVMDSPIVRTSALLAALLGLAALAAGIGFFSLKGWARTVAIWQAGLSIPFGLYLAWFSPQGRLSGMFVRFYEGLGDPAALAGMRQMQAIGQWLYVGILLVWNGLLIWFLVRESVKAQFVSRGS